MTTKFTLNEWFERNTRNFLLIVIILILTIFSNVYYRTDGYGIIKSIYDQKSFGIANQLIKGQDQNDIEAYFTKADSLVGEATSSIAFVCMVLFIISFFRDKYKRYGFLVSLLALSIAIHSQWDALTNLYVINADVNQHIWWMRQFQDPELFNNNLLTSYAKSLQPGGILTFFYLSSFIIDPVILTKYLPIILLTIATLYMYRLFFLMTQRYDVSVIGSLFFAVTPYYIFHMAGGHAHTYGYTLMAAFLFYLVKRDHRKVAVVMVLQSLFFPIVFVVSTFTYLLSFLQFEGIKPYWDKTKGKLVYLLIAVVISGTILSVKYFYFGNPEIGKPYHKEDVLKMVEFTEKGRWMVIPTPSLDKEIAHDAEKGIFIFSTIRKSELSNDLKTQLLNKHRLLYGIFGIILLMMLIRKRLGVPIEIVYLLISSVTLFILADIFLLQLYVPDRYLTYSIPLFSLIIFVCTFKEVLAPPQWRKFRKVIQAVVLMFVFSSVNLSKGVALVDYSKDKAMYTYLNSLPKGVMIASHPEMADGIPTFAKRKVFINSELSEPLFDSYWEKIKERTTDFFTAYYAQDIKNIYQFCIENKIDYLIVDRRHFKEAYYAKQNVYFEPFSSLITKLAIAHDQYALLNISSDQYLFQQGDIFIVHRDSLKK